MRKQADHRCRAAVRFARPGRITLAAVLMNAPTLGAAAFVGWLAVGADQPAVAAAGWILFTLLLFWAVLVTLDSWRVLRRYARRASTPPS